MRKGFVTRIFCMSEFTMPALFVALNYLLIYQSRMYSCFE